MPFGVDDCPGLGLVYGERLRRILTRIFLRNEKDKQPLYGASEKFRTDPYWRQGCRTASWVWLQEL